MSQGQLTVKEDDCGKCSYAFLYTLGKVGAGIYAAITVSFWAIPTIPIALFSSCSLWQRDGKDAFYIHHLLMMALYNTLWIIVFRDYDSKQVSWEISSTWWAYLLLFVNLMVDCYGIRKFLHKIGHRCTDKEIKKEMKALKRQKKQWKMEQLNQMMIKMQTKYEKDTFMKTRSSKERKLYEKETRRLE